jgi:hypothetical protein
LLWHFHVYKYCIPNWFIPSTLHFSPFYLSPLLMVISTDLKILYSFLLESTSTIFTFFTSSFYFPCLVNALPLAWSVFHSCPSLFRSLFIVHWDFCLGTIPINTLCLSQCNPLHCTSSPFSPILCCLTVFSMFSRLVPTHMWCTLLFFTIFLSFFYYSHGLLYQGMHFVCISMYI